MRKSHSYRSIPTSRIATFDVYSIGVLRHHVCALLEFDVTDSRSKIRTLRRSGIKISFTAWLVKAISMAIADHPEVTAFLVNKKKLIIFDDVDVAFMVEKERNGQRVPISMVIEQANEQSITQLTGKIEDAMNRVLSSNETVIDRKPGKIERIYFYLPGFIRRRIWRMMLRFPKVAYKQMGNVSITSLTMAGKIDGRFIHRSIHPVSIGIGSVLKKPVVHEGHVKAREMVQITLLLDHDVVDGIPMAKFVNTLSRRIETGTDLREAYS